MSKDAPKKGDKDLNGVTQAEFARMIGVSRNTVGKAIQSRRLEKSVIVSGNTKKIIPKIGIEEWEENRRSLLHTQKAIKGKKDEIAQKEEKLVRTLMEEDESSGESTSQKLLKARAKKEKFAADLLEIEYGLKTHEVIERSLAISSIKKIARIVKAKFTSLPRKIAFEVSQITDLKAIEAYIEKEINDICRDLGNETIEV